MDIVNHVSGIPKTHFLKKLLKHCSGEIPWDFGTEIYRNNSGAFLFEKNAYYTLMFQFYNWHG